LRESRCPRASRAREFPILEKVSRADQDKAYKVTSGSRIGRQPDIVLPEQILSEVLCLVDHLPHVPKQTFRI
jgi:hypothetical protein